MNSNLPTYSLGKLDGSMSAKNDLKAPYDFDSYAEPFFPVGERLESLAAQAEEEGDIEKAAELYLRAACVYRAAGPPAPPSDAQKLAWQKQRIAFYSGAKLVHHPLHSQMKETNTALDVDTWTLPWWSASSPILMQNLLLAKRTP